MKHLFANYTGYISVVLPTLPACTATRKWSTLKGFAAGAAFSSEMGRKLVWLSQKHRMDRCGRLFGKMPPNIYLRCTLHCYIEVQYSRVARQKEMSAQMFVFLHMSTLVWTALVANPQHATCHSTRIQLLIVWMLLLEQTYFCCFFCT
jgi:hypothetical protein